MRETRLTQLPKIGDELMHMPTLSKIGISQDVPLPCVVVYVNEPHSYYTVQFKDSGIKESYKLGTYDY